jgi:hypothetical protein
MGIRLVDSWKISLNPLQKRMHFRSGFPTMKMHQAGNYESGSPFLKLAYSQDRSENLRDPPKSPLKRGTKSPVPPF